MSTPPELDAAGLVRRLAAGEVDFVIVGGVAAVLHGSARVTRDLDVTFDTARDNLERLGKVLVALRPRLRGAEDVEGFVPDAGTLRNVELLTLRTDLGDLDLLSSPPGAPRYRELAERAERYEIAGVTVAVAGVEDLLAMKRTAGRPKDLADVAELEAILRLRNR